MKHKLTNFWLRFRSNFIFFFSLYWVDDVKWNLIEEDDHHEDFTKTTKESLSKNYFFNMPWGLYNPEDNKQWFDSSAVKMSRWGLELHVNDHVLKDGVVRVNTGVGLVCSQYNLSYGLYEWEVIMPEGRLLWPAIWLSHSTEWPPEIDVLEGYTDELGLYRSRLESNIYYRAGGFKISTGAIRHGRFLKAGNLNLKCLWTKDLIEIYYNNVLVRRVTNPVILQCFNKDPWMKVIMNNAIIRQVALRDHAVEPFIVESFIHYKLKNQ